MTPKLQKRMSACVAATGLALVAMMISLEGELGALPLGLLLAGAVGYATAMLRERTRY